MKCVKPPNPPPSESLQLIPETNTEKTMSLTVADLNKTGEVYDQNIPVYNSNLHLMILLKPRNVNNNISTTVSILF